jgi:hypothetical protein
MTNLKFVAKYKEKTMVNKKLLSGIPATALVFVLVGFAGCGTAPQASLSAQADGGAAQLAADLGKAVNGGTVTLTGWAGLKTALTVPEGVTLDLTGEGAALELQDGAVLTVNGTVNATGHGDHGKGWVAGSLRMGDGTAVIAGTGTISLTSKGRLLNIGSDKGKRQLTLDGVTLVGLSDNDSPLVGVYENGALVLKSGAITGNARVNDEWAGGGGVEVHKGTFTMEDGAISGNSAEGKDGSGGGGVNIGEEAVFTMSGGEISGNSAKSTAGRYANGGGVSVNKGTFTMSGSAITGNTATAAVTGMGGGVRIDESVFTMSGGEISGNTAKGGTGAAGGGIYTGPKSTFIMEGGTVYGSVGNLPDGVDESFANIMLGRGSSATLHLFEATAKWGTGGTYTKGGVPQSGGSDIVQVDKSIAGSTDDTLIAAP